MATIVIHREETLLIVSVTGNLNADETIAVVKEYYADPCVKDVIWDLTNGSLNLIPRNGFESIAAATKEVLACGARLGGKTVFVGTATAEYGLMRMYSTIADMSGIRIQYEVFRTLAEAKTWIAHDHQT